jgi:hypothetical protein
VSFAAITLCVASQRVFIFVYFVIGSVRKLLVTPSYFIVDLGVPSLQIHIYCRKANQSMYTENISN